MNRDPVVGMWRPVPPKPTQAAADTLAQSLPELILSPDTNFKTAVFAATKKLLPDGAAEMIVDFCRDTQQLATLRAAALDASREIAPQDFLELATMSLADPHSELRITARRLLAESNPNQVADSIIAALDAPETRERQAAYATLVHLPSETVLPVLLQKIADLSSGMIPPDTRLDLREAVQAITSSSPPLNDALTAYLKQTPTSTDSAAYRDALEGGDAERGRILFYEKTQLSCLRCHRIGLDGGNVGPNLSDVGKLRSREHLLQSIVEPNAEITEKYGTIVVLDDSGKTTSGILHMENEHSLRLLTAEGEFVTIAQEAIIDRRTGESAMPKNLIESISPMELRDLVEFLSQQKSPRQPDVESLEIDGGLGNSDPSTEQDPNQ
jgi:quinoprotein glucose dehydrogenase